jgi:hypothetical protein
VTLVFLPPQKFVRPPCWYLQIVRYETVRIWDSLQWYKFTSDFIKIRSAVLELKDADRQTDSRTDAGAKYGLWVGRVRLAGTAFCQRIEEARALQDVIWCGCKVF